CSVRLQIDGESCLLRPIELGRAAAGNLIDKVRVLGVFRLARQGQFHGPCLERHCEELNRGWIQVELRPNLLQHSSPLVRREGQVHEHSDEAHPFRYVEGRRALVPGKVEGWVTLVRHRPPGKIRDDVEGSCKDWPVFGDDKVPEDRGRAYSYALGES